jgi:hypothetical protein
VRLLPQTTRCFASGCAVVLFDESAETTMEGVLRSVAAYVKSGPGPTNDQPRYWYAPAINRCYCLDHGRQYERLVRELPLAVQELSALAALYPNYRDNLKEDEVARRHVEYTCAVVYGLRIIEELLVPLERDPEDVRGLGSRWEGTT